LFASKGLGGSAGRAEQGGARMHQGDLSSPQCFLDRHGKTADQKAWSPPVC
jgi:hypothetical protein